MPQQNHISGPTSGEELQICSSRALSRMRWTELVCACLFPSWLGALEMEGLILPVEVFLDMHPTFVSQEESSCYRASCEIDVLTLHLLS